MQTRRRVAQAIASLGSLILIAGAGLHSVLGSRVIFGALQGTTMPQDIIRGLKAVWLVVGWHWIVMGVVALVAAFVRTAPHRAILLLCGIIALADAAGIYAALGIFIGNEMIFASAVAFLAAAALFPPAQR
jgi:hypothetical protein